MWAQLWRAAVFTALVLAGAVYVFLEGLGGHRLGWVLATGGVALVWLLWWRRSGRAHA